MTDTAMTCVLWVVLVVASLCALWWAFGSHWEIEARAIMLLMNLFTVALCGWALARLA